MCIHTGGQVCKTRVCLHKSQMLILDCRAHCMQQVLGYSKITEAKNINIAQHSMFCSDALMLQKASSLLYQWDITGRRH